MLRDGFRPQAAMLVGLVPSSGRSVLVVQGKSIHEVGDMPERDVVAWNALITGYSKNGDGFRPQAATLVGLVPSSGRFVLVVQGKSIHEFGVEAGFDRDSNF
ncbi:hypothetical protein REPUB_Repub02eG0048900 [Reevesia pubescens]